MTAHIYELIEVLDPLGMRLRCPDCGRQVLLIDRDQQPKVIEVEGDKAAFHQWTLTNPGGIRLEMEEVIKEGEG